MRLLKRESAGAEAREPYCALTARCPKRSAGRPIALESQSLVHAIEIHKKLAELYEKLLEIGEAPRSRLHMASATGSAEASPLTP